MKNKEYDWDYIGDQLFKVHGWGDGAAASNQEDFENSDYFSDSGNDDKTVEEFHSYLLKQTHGI